ncbi:MAG: diguanylate cyclase [Clostridia bacterium]|nr:diguanylate cyclase [Clostridia bacterium]
MVAMLKRVLLASLLMSLLIFVVVIFKIPNPNMVLVSGLVIITSIYGYSAGGICLISMVLYSMYFFSTDHTFYVYTATNLHKIIVIVLSALFIYLAVGQLKSKQERTERELLDINDILERDNIKLKEESRTDSLTGLGNRVALIKDYSKFPNHRLSVMIMDIDNFKSANDNYGHVAGDSILKQTGKTLIDVFGQDRCYRYGGDEFLVICKGLDRRSFAYLVQELKDRLSTIHINEDGGKVSFSGGFVYGNCTGKSDLSRMIQKADEQLYKAKRNGKNMFFGGEYSRVTV